MNAIAARLEQAYPKDDKDKEVLVLPLRANMTNSARATLQMLMGAVGLLLLLACANVANMLLARATSRTRELALRAAVGASRWQIVRQLLVESALLRGIGWDSWIHYCHVCDGCLARVRSAESTACRRDQVGHARDFIYGRIRRIGDVPIRSHPCLTGFARGPERSA